MICRTIQEFRSLTSILTSGICVSLAFYLGPIDMFKQRYQPRCANLPTKQSAAARLRFGTDGITRKQSERGTRK